MFPKRFAESTGSGGRRMFQKNDLVCVLPSSKFDQKSPKILSQADSSIRLRSQRVPGDLSEMSPATKQLSTLISLGKYI